MSSSSAKALLAGLPAIRSEEDSFYETQRKLLLEICQNGKTDELIKLLHTLRQSKKLSQQIDIEKFLNEPFQRYNWTPLMMAVYNGHKDLISYLIDNKAYAESHRYKIDVYWASHSGTTALDLLNPKHKDADKIEKIIKREHLRQERINNKNNWKKGYHETSLEAFNFIINDMYQKRYPMIGGKGGYFGGGIYFAKSEEESGNKALHNGGGFECVLKMGNIYKIDSVRKRKYFYRDYCYADNYKDYEKMEDTFLYTETEYQDEEDEDEDEPDTEEWVQPYGTPCDVMQRRLLEDGYDSVWGHHNDKIPNTNKRILHSGDEFVIYSADQIDIRKLFLIHPDRKSWDLIMDFTDPTQKSHSMKKLIPLELRMMNKITENKTIESISFEPSRAYLAYIFNNPIVETTEGSILTVQDISDRTKKTNDKSVLLIDNKGIGIYGKTRSVSQFSPDGSMICYSLGDRIQLKEILDDKEYYIFSHKEKIRSVAFSRNGKYLFSVDEKKECLIHKIDSIRENSYVPIHKRLEHMNGTQLVSSPHKNRLMVYEGDDTRSLSIYTYPDTIDRNMPQKELLQIERTYSSKTSINSFEFTPDGAYLVIAGLDMDIHFLNIRDKTKDTTIKMGVKEITCMTISPNGHYLAIGTQDGRLLIWDIRDINSISLIHISLPYYTHRGINFMSFTKDGLELVIVTTATNRASSKKFFSLVQIFNSSKFT